MRLRRYFHFIRGDADCVERKAMGEEVPEESRRGKSRRCDNAYVYYYNFMTNLPSICSCSCIWPAIFITALEVIRHVSRLKCNASDVEQALQPAESRITD